MFGKRNPGIVASHRRLSVLAASVVVAALASLVSSTQAEAAGWTTCPSTGGGVCRTTYAYLDVTCRTDLNSDGTKTWNVTAIHSGSGWDAPISYAYSVGITGYNPWTVGWLFARWGQSIPIYGLRVKQTTPPKTVVVAVRYAYAPSGSWINGPVEYAAHNTSGPSVGSVATGNACTLK